jgi:hypothetical protein
MSRENFKPELAKIRAEAKEKREAEGRPLKPPPSPAPTAGTNGATAPPPQEMMPWPEALQKAIITSVQFRRLLLKPKALLLSDWLAEGDLGFIFASRGTGKTWLAIGIAEALSLGDPNRRVEGACAGESSVCGR